MHQYMSKYPLCRGSVDMKRLHLGLVSLFAAAGMTVMGATASADIIPNPLTFDFTSDHCTGGCLTNQTSGGTITVTDNGTGTLHFDVELANGNYFINTGFEAT